MNPDEKAQLLNGAATELAKVAGFDGLVIIASFTAADGSSCTASAVRGNRHAAVGSADEWLRGMKNREDGYNLEKGRYDAVVNRQRTQARQQPPPLPPPK